MRRVNGGQAHSSLLTPHSSLFTPHSSPLPFHNSPMNNGQRNRCRVRDVEALDGARQVDAQDEIAGLAHPIAQPLPFGAERQDQRLAQGRLLQGALALRIEADAQEAALARTPVAAGLWRIGTMTALTAKALAVRRIAPTLCGSVIWSSAST